MRILRSYFKKLFSESTIDLLRESLSCVKMYIHKILSILTNLLELLEKEFLGNYEVRRIARDK